MLRPFQRKGEQDYDEATSQHHSRTPTPGCDQAHQQSQRDKRPQRFKDIAHTDQRADLRLEGYPVERIGCAVQSGCKLPQRVGAEQRRDREQRQTDIIASG